MKEIDKILKALADPNRLRILKLIEKRGMCVCELTAVLGITQPAISRHLKKLEQAGLVSGRQNGAWKDYSAGGESAETRRLLRLLSGWLDREKSIKSDLKKAARTDRMKLCCKTERKKT